jgi:DNA-binding winged helix-turn-helix (wHTH) protein
MGTSAGSGYRFGPFVLNRGRGCLQKGGVDLNLRPKAFDVLCYLVERAGRLASKDELVAAVWPNVIVNDDALAQCIRDIRKLLNDENEQFIRTVPRRGYMFVAETVPLGGTDAPTPAEATAIVSSLRRPPAPIAAVAALAVLVAALAAWSLGWFGQRLPVAETRLTIAVLPFATQGDGGVAFPRPHSHRPQFQLPLPG